MEFPTGEARGIKEFYKPAPYPSIDAIIENGEKIVLIRRGIEPFKGEYSFPGGFVDWGESVEDAVVREVKEETSIDVQPIAILGVYSEMGRDPRGSTMSVAFVCKFVGGDLKAGDDAKDPEWVPIERAKEVLKMSDHPKMLSDYLKWKEDKTRTFWSSK